MTKGPAHLRQFTRDLAAALVAVCLTGAVPAQINNTESATIAAALDAIEVRDFAQALAKLSPLAELGNRDAQFLMGLLNEALAIPGSTLVDAASWYAKSAAAGHAKAQNNLGAMYFDGRGVNQDVAQALLWYGRAAEQGNPQAQLNYALMLGLGLGQQSTAAPAGSSGTPEGARDPAGMLRWLLLASEQNYDRAQVQLGKLYLAGRDFPADMSEAAYWFRRAAESGSGASATEAQYLLAAMLQKGEGMKRDLVEAIVWFLRAAAAEPSSAMAASNYELGVIYELGLGVTANAEKSASYYRRAADAGHARAREKINVDKSNTGKIRKAK